MRKHNNLFVCRDIKIQVKITFQWNSLRNQNNEPNVCCRQSIEFNGNIHIHVFMYIQDYTTLTVTSVDRIIISEQYWFDAEGYRSKISGMTMLLMSTLWNERWWMWATCCCWWKLTFDLLYLFFQARNYISSLPHMPKRNFTDVFIGANPQGNNIRE